MITDEAKNAKRREYRRLNSAKINAAASEWRSRNPEKMAAYKRNDRVRNRARQDAADRAYKTANAERVAAYLAAYRRRWAATPQGRESVRAAKQRRRAAARSLPVAWSTATQAKCKALWPGVCVYCDLRLADSWDHFVPVLDPACPGTVPWNMVHCCSVCNSAKGAKPAMRFLGKERHALVLSMLGCTDGR